MFEEELNQTWGHTWGRGTDAGLQKVLIIHHICDSSFEHEAQQLNSTIWKHEHTSCSEFRSETDTWSRFWVHLSASQRALSHTAYKMPVRKKNSLKRRINAAAWSDWGGLLIQDYWLWSGWSRSFSNSQNPVKQSEHVIRAGSCRSCSVSCEQCDGPWTGPGTSTWNSAWNLCWFWLQDISLLSPPPLHGDEQTSAWERLSLFHDEPIRNHHMLPHMSADQPSAPSLASVTHSHAHSAAAVTC